MSDTKRPDHPSRRAFVLGGLAGLAAAGCKIEPILDLEPASATELAFPTLPPKIPDQLEDAEATLRALTEELLGSEGSRLIQGDLRDRAVDDDYVVHHFELLLAKFGLDPAGTRGGWRQPVELSTVEPTDAPALVELRGEATPTRVQPRDEGEAKAQVEGGEASPTPEAQAPTPTPPSEGESPESEPDETEAPTKTDAELPRDALDLASGGAFHQPGSPSVEVGLLPSPLLNAGDALPPAALSGRVAWLRAPKKFDLLDGDAPERVATLAAAAREAGAVACVLLTQDEGPGIERFRARWARKLRRAEDVPAEALALVGLLDAGSSEAVAARLEAGTLAVLDLDLATRERTFTTHNLMARTAGRERPDEAVVLTCAWDTPDPQNRERDTLRLLTTLATMAQLADWQRRSIRSHRSLLVLLTADGGRGAGQLEHARWAASSGIRPTIVIGLDRPSHGEPSPYALVSGHIDEQDANLTRDVLAREDREILLSNELSIPALGAYLRYQHPVMTVGEPPDEALVDLPDAPEQPPPTLDAEADEDAPGENEGAVEGEGEGPGEGEQPSAAEPDHEGLHADVRMLRNLMLALGADDSP